MHDSCFTDSQVPLEGGFERNMDASNLTQTVTSRHEAFPFLALQPASLSPSEADGSSDSTATCAPAAQSFLMMPSFCLSSLFTSAKDAWSNFTIYLWWRPICDAVIIMRETEKCVPCNIKEIFIQFINVTKATLLFKITILVENGKCMIMYIF